jgi:DNA-binding transcriptional regulator YhcF (GntR family)
MANSEPWSKFFWADYDADEGLRVCSLAAQGLWMRMLCLMARATPKGELRVGGKPCSVQDMAKIVSENEETVQRLLNELKDRGVFSVNRVSVIFCRRMRKDAELSRKRAEAGRNGGIVSSGKRKENGFCSSKIQANEQAKTKPQKPETRNQIDNNPAQLSVTREAARGDPNEFDRVQSECLKALGSNPVADLVIGPMVELVRKYGQERVSFQLASESRRQRHRPVKSWKLWAQIVSENLADIKPEPPCAGRKIDIGGMAPMPEENLRRAVSNWRQNPQSWAPQWGDPPDENPKIQAWIVEIGEPLHGLETEAA